MSFISNMKSDLYKFIHSPLLYIHIFIPAVGVCLFLWYYSYSPWSGLNKLSGYVEALSICFPVLIGVITAMQADAEQKTADFQTILSVPAAKYIPHLSRLTILVLCGFCSTLISLLTFGWGFHQLGYTTFNLLFFIQSAILLSISVLPLYFLQYLISFICGKGSSLGLGIIGSLLSALLLTGLGDGIWFALPWGITARFSEALLIATAMHIDFFQVHGIIQSVISLILFSLLLIILSVIVFQKWEGRKTED